ncbi:sterol desaturase family protein [Rudanella paleaurantiibacter]|uniref:Sterol desaturase family protein n=1 Tax=Rudanella paleaurantiibacter TaxID=2614655 RepID=A0A7J5TXA5_9BACT|nr:sterol desaturase family protein [Rudanella paleaurantiibacter]KAB7729053.1 sterol desaturase family protein [Rudanella paleaurantiibacter]
MNFNPIMLAIPFFFLAMGIEIWLDRYRQTKLYRLNDSITNLSAGTSQQVVGIFLKVITLGLYEAVHANFALFQVPHTWWSWILAFVLYDLCYYWAHRLSHEVNLFWSGHVVHHQSEEYNLSVALRQSWFQGVWTAPVYLPMALLGFDTTQLLVVGGINLIYQFWIHTEMIDRMGVLEWFMNTPSHHRVHHGRNPKYIDKNHGGTFIIWDRLFGTFQVEEERPVYGITTPINSWNPVWANFSHYEHIGHQLRNAPTLTDKLKVLFYKPGWDAKMAVYHPIPDVSRESYQKFDTEVPQGVNYYVLFQYTLLVLATFPFLQFQGQLGWGEKGAIALLIGMTVVNFGFFFEGRPWAYRFEAFRLLACTGLGVWLLLPIPAGLWVAGAVGGLGAISLVWLWRLSRTELNTAELNPVSHTDAVS